jgi:hypothetical protein
MYKYGIVFFMHKVKQSELSGSKHVENIID